MDIKRSQKLGYFQLKTRYKHSGKWQQNKARKGQQKLNRNKGNMLISCKFNVHSSVQSFGGYKTHQGWLNHHSKQQHQGSIDIHDRFSNLNKEKVGFHQNPTQARN